MSIGNGYSGGRGEGGGGEVAVGGGGEDGEHVSEKGVEERGKRAFP